MGYEIVKNLFWLDMEMTGLDVNKEVIIEVAAIVTNIHLQEVESYEEVVKQPESYLKTMDTWNTNQHTKSGLLAKIPNGKEPSFVEQKLVDMIERNFPEAGTEMRKRPILAGNSIMQDRIFIDRYFKNLSSKLHYRMVDVSSFKILLSNRFGIEYKKKNSHRALDDVRESIEELRYYLAKFEKTLVVENK